MNAVDQNPDELLRCAEKLSAHDDYRVLRRIGSVTEFHTSNPGASDKLSIGAVVDVETTGLDPAVDKIIELAIQRFRYNSSGEIVEVGAPRVWKEDPGFALDPFITQLTGLNDADLAAEKIDDAEAEALLASATVLIAHNAAFDRPFIERRLRRISGKAWGCSLAELDWLALGFEGRKLSHLLVECGWFYEGHRADNDVLALLHLLAHRVADGETILCKLLECAQKPTWRVTAKNSPFETKDQLKARGYRWNSEEKVWSKQIAQCDLAAEKQWLSTEVYGSECEAETTELSWFNRYS